MTRMQHLISTGGTWLPIHTDCDDGTPGREVVPRPLEPLSKGSQISVGKSDEDLG